MVTAGANQAFVNLVLTLTDASDKVVLFKPYYFNHIMALQMSGGAEKVLLGPCDNSTLHPDLGWLQEQLQGPDPPKMVVIVNPCNPTGELLGFDICRLICDVWHTGLVLRTSPSNQWHHHDGVHEGPPRP